MDHAIVGYHGTDSCAAKSILDSQYFKPSVGLDEWLGDGVYFFLNWEDAQWWCEILSKDQSRQKPFVILSAPLIPKTYVIDFVGSYKDQRAFKEYCDKVANKCSKLPGGKLRRNYMSLAIKLMVKRKKPDMIIGSFSENRAFWFKQHSDLEKFPVQISQVQICVLNNECIGKIELHKEVV